MAPRKPKAVVQETDPLESAALSKLAAARTWKSYTELDVKEAYFFAAPNRQRQISSMTVPSEQRMLDAPDLNTDVAFLLTQDFVTEIVNGFMPEATPWCERGPGMDLPDGVWDKIKAGAKIAEPLDDRRILGAILLVRDRPREIAGLAEQFRGILEEWRVLLF